MNYLSIAARRLTSLLLCALLMAFGAQAQDVIYELNGHELHGQVIEITPTQVLYRTEGSDPALPPAVLEKNTLFMVKFANGTRETFLQAAPAAPAGATGGSSTAPSDPATLDAQELYRRGQQDALKLHNYKGVFWGTYAATLTTGYGGLIVGGIAGLTRPQAARNPLVPAQMLRSPSYVDGYETQAQRRKLGKAAEGMGAAVGTGFGVLIIVLLVLAAGGYH